VREYVTRHGIAALLFDKADLGGQPEIGDIRPLYDQVEQARATMTVSGL
jgi:hypothetical protein